MSDPTTTISGALAADPELRRKVCSEPECERPRHCRGLCRSHYGKRRWAGTLPPMQDKPTACRVDGCGNGGPLTRGYCKMHYARLRRQGGPGEAAKVHVGRYEAVAKCAAEGCSKKPKSRWYCTAHYKRLRKHGDPLGGKRPRTFEESFGMFVQKADGCWDWGGTVHANGYGIISSGRKRMLAHRWSYEHHVGPIPDGLVIDHLCRNRKCVNPSHLEPVTGLENLRRGLGYALQNGMRRSCINGHEYTDENTYLTPGGKPRCRQCSRNRDAGRKKAA